MTRRSVIDTEPELNTKAIDLASLLGLPPSAFVLHHIKRLVIDAQATVVRRTVENLEASAEREWTTAEPVPSGNGVSRIRAVD